jgi:hypothetical protein
MKIAGVCLFAATLAIPLAGARAQKFNFGVELKDFECGQYDDLQAAVWYGHDTRMTIAELAAYCAPVIWFSPDEPLLGRREGKAITIPEPFPFEPSDSIPVVYYRVRKILTRTGGDDLAYTPDPNDRGAAVIDLEHVVGIDLDFFFYYSSESGLGGHKHDVESAEFQIVVPHRPECNEERLLVVTRVLGKAHGVQWYDNTLGVDEHTRLPIHLFSEEGKHATCTDKNADGYFTPSYDVNRRVNDAWGVRDVISSGSLFTGGFQSWMAKVRRPEHRVFPPLPEDSPLRARHTRDGVYAPDYAIYELRPFPTAERAEPDLVHFIADKGDPNWPEVDKWRDIDQFRDWADTEAFVKSLSVAFYADGNYGISFSFPFFIVRNLEDPMGGGFITHRMAFTDTNLRDFTWMANYSPSASRWIDPYFAAGVEWDKEDAPGGGTTTEADPVLETGLKFRASLAHTPLKFVTKVVDFWGLRFGVKGNGFFDIDTLRYVIEVGAGTW